MVELFVPGKPVPKARPKIGRWGAYTPKPTKEYQDLVKDAWVKKYGNDIIYPKENALEVLIIIYAPGTGPDYSIRGDWDNYGKSICDALNGLAYNDDAQITKGTVEKMRSKSAGKEIGVYIRIQERGEG